MKNFFYKFILPPGLIAIILVLGLAISRQVRRNYALHLDVVKIENKISKLQNINEEANREIKSFEDPSTIDKEARSRLNLKKEGENVVVILPSQTQKNRIEEISDKIPQEKTFWNSLRSWIGF